MDLEVIDDFLNEPEAVKDYTRSLIYPGADPESGQSGTIANAPLWQDMELYFYPLQPRMCFFRRGDGKATKSLIHSDRSLGIKTAILYLNTADEIPAGIADGTTFYRRKLDGSVRPSGGARQLDFSTPEFQDVGKWEAVERVEMRFNRLIYYDSRLYHSRTSVQHWPGRLVQVLFF